MKIFSEINFLERMDQLIRLKATGTPLNLSKKLGLSKRQVFRYIDEMKGMGFKIDYCKKRGTYYYKEDTFLKFKLSIIENGKERMILGGESFFNFFETFFQSAKKWHSEPPPLYQVDNHRTTKRC